MRQPIITALILVGLVSPIVVAAQSADPVGKVNFSGGSVAAGIGFSWGSGTLEFQGKTYPFKLTGFAVGDVGAASIDATGEVYHLVNVEDFDGNYAAAGAGATLAGGGTIITMQNAHGVVIQAHSATTGLHLNLGPSGITFSLEK